MTNWLLMGKGEPFSILPTTDEYLSRDVPPESLTDSGVQYSVDIRRIPKEYTDHIDKTLKILKSGTLYANALANNIDAFCNSVEKSEESIELLKEINKKLGDSKQIKREFNEIKSEWNQVKGLIRPEKLKNNG